MDRPAPTARATPPSVMRKEMVVPTPDQLSKLVRAADAIDPVIACATALAALTGARRGELVALKWSDIDLVVGRVRFARSLTVADGEQHTGSTKTHAAVNWLSIRSLSKSSSADGPMSVTSRSVPIRPSLSTRTCCRTTPMARCRSIQTL